MKQKKDNYKDIKKLKPYFLKYKGLCLKILLINVFILVVSTLYPIIEQKILSGFEIIDINFMFKWILIYFVINLLGASIGVVFNKMTFELNHKVDLDLKKDLFDSLMDLEYQNYAENSGVFVSRIFNANELSQVFEQIILYSSDVIRNLFYVIFIFTLNPYLAAFLIFNVLVDWFVYKEVIKCWVKYKKSNNKLREEAMGAYNDTIRGIKEVKNLHIEDNVLNRVDKLLNHQIDESRKHSFRIENINFIEIVISKTFDVLFYLLSIYFILNGSFTLASFFIFIIYKDRVVNILPYFAKIKEILQTSNVTAEELFEVIEGSKFKKEKFGKKEVELSGDIVLKDVVFSYTKDEVNVLDGLSLTLNPGINALVGASGAGKSTILNLINKTYNINSGSIETGGYNIKTLSKDSLRGSISVVSQEPYLFNLTIKENLRLVDPKISDEDIIEVCKKCRLHNDISMMEKGYDSLLGENGVRLSVGQKQRLAIARAFIKGSKIILMDEPTSALDNKNQHQITMAINEIVKDSGATVVIVAHRLSTIKDANNIIVLDNGKVDSVGNHDSLLKKSLIYQSLYNEEANLN